MLRMIYKIILVGWLLQNQILLIAQNNFKGIVVDGGTKELIIFSKVAFPMENDYFQTDLYGEYELISHQDSVLAFVNYTGYTLAKKMLKRSQISDTIKLEAGLTIPPASIMGNYNYPTEITDSYIKDEAENRLYWYWIHYHGDRLACERIELINGSLQLKIIDCDHFEFNIKGKQAQFLLFNLYTQQELELNRIIDFNALPKGIYELYISHKPYYWFNTPYTDNRSGIREHEINQPAAVLYNFFD